MIFVYIRKWDIVYRSQEKLQSISCDYVLETHYGMKDNIILEDNQVKLYTNSKQYLIDKDIVWVKEKLQKTEEELLQEKYAKQKLQNDYLKLSNQHALLITKIQNDQNATNDMKWDQSGWSYGLNLKP